LPPPTWKAWARRSAPTSRPSSAWSWTGRSSGSAGRAEPCAAPDVGARRGLAQDQGGPRRPPRSAGVGLFPIPETAYLRITMPNGAATAHLYRPKLVTVLSEGYGADRLKRDLLAGLTVAIVALPLSMAIAVASGVSPDRGLYAAVIGGFFVSALGGSRYQIGGPAGAFIVLVAPTVAPLGVDGLLLTALLSGIMLTLIGLSRLGTLIRYIPHAVTVGFTCGIAVIIFASQIKDLAGLTLPGAEPGPLLPKLVALGQALPTVSPSALTIGAG